MNEILICIKKTNLKLENPNIVPNIGERQKVDVDELPQTGQAVDDDVASGDVDGQADGICE